MLPQGPPGRQAGHLAGRVLVGGNPWLLRLADADGTDEVVLKTGDVSTDLDRR
jgi:hypothetical protein